MLKFCNTYGLALVGWVCLLFTVPKVRAEDDPKTKVAMLPLSSIGVSAEICQKLRQKLSEALGKNENSEVMNLDLVDFTVLEVCGQKQDVWDCLEKDDNLFLIGRKLSAKAVVAVKVAAMGQKLALKLRLADVSTSTVSTEIVSSQSGDEEAVVQSLASLMLLHYRLSPKEPTPWYSRWQSWTLIGAGVVVAAGVAAGVVLVSQQNGSPRDLDYHESLP